MNLILANTTFKCDNLSANNNFLEFFYIEERYYKRHKNEYKIFELLISCRQFIKLSIILPYFLVIELQDNK